MLLVYNPLPVAITRIIKVPLYYTGLSSTAQVAEKGKQAKALALSRDYSIELTVKLPAGGYSWWEIR
jgi:hypothetical protein